MATGGSAVLTSRFLPAARNQPPISPGDVSRMSSAPVGSSAFARLDRVGLSGWWASADDRRAGRDLAKKGASAGLPGVGAGFDKQACHVGCGCTPSAHTVDRLVVPTQDTQHPCVYPRHVTGQVGLWHRHPTVPSISWGQPRSSVPRTCLPRHVQCRWHSEAPPFTFSKKEFALPLLLSTGMRIR